jgi:hypothetical protein
MTRKPAPPSAPPDATAPAGEPAAANPLPTTAGAWRIEDGKLVLEDPPTKPAPLPGAEEV